MKTMKVIYSFLLLTFIALGVQAYVVPTFRDIKPASQVMLESQNFGAPVVTTTNYVKTTYAGPTSTAAVTLTSFTAQPDVPRNLTITPTSTTADIAGCTVVVNGTNYLNGVISEDFVIANNQTTATTGAKAFKTVSSVVFPLNCEETAYSATWIIGVGEKLGLKRCMAYAGDWAWSMIDGVYETTRATIVADSNEVEKNTADFNGTMDTSAVFIGRFIQNFACLP